MVALLTSLSAEGIFLDCIMSRTAQPQDSSKMDVEHWHMPVWASGINISHSISIYLFTAICQVKIYICLE